MIATPIMLLGLLGLLIWGGLWGWRNLTAPLPTPEPVPCVMQDQEFVYRAEVIVNVYNGGYTRGLAERVASTLRDAGFNVARVTNTEEPVTNTIIRGGDHGAAPVRLVQTGFVDAETDFDERIDGTVDVLVGTDFGGYADPWQRNYTQNGQYCMPAELYNATASPSPEATGTEEPAGEESPDEE